MWEPPFGVGVFMGVRRLLVTSPDEEQIVGWHRRVAMKLNNVSRRGQTLHYTCMDEDFDFALEQAKPADVTVEEIMPNDDTAGREIYVLRRLGSHQHTWGKELERLRGGAAEVE